MQVERRISKKDKKLMETPKKKVFEGLLITFNLNLANLIDLFSVKKMV